MPAVRIDAYKSVAFGSITNSYTAVGTPVAHNWRILVFVNNTNGDLKISADGTTDNLFIPANSFKLFDFTTNSDQDAQEALVVGLQTQFYVKYSTAPTSGALYIEGLYAKGQ